MWAELDSLQQILPEEAVNRVKVNLSDRTKFDKGPKSNASPSEPKTLIHVRKYKGPVIVPQMPKSVKEHIPFQSFVEEENQGHFDLVRHQKKIIKDRATSNRNRFGPDKSKLKLTPNERNLLLQPEYKHVLEQQKYPWSVKSKPKSVDLGAPLAHAHRNKEPPNIEHLHSEHSPAKSPIKTRLETVKEVDTAQDHYSAEKRPYIGGEETALALRESVHSSILEHIHR